VSAERRRLDAVIRANSPALLKPGSDVAWLIGIAKVAIDCVEQEDMGRGYNYEHLKAAVTASAPSVPTREDAE
jgi:hypothetical protein